MMGGMGGVFMWLFWVLIVLVIGLIIWAVVYVVSRSQNNIQNRTSRETPIEILKRRYANGEITDKEYEEKKRNL
jgi:putative membrane protein